MIDVATYTVRVTLSNDWHTYPMWCAPIDNAAHSAREIIQQPDATEGRIRNVAIICGGVGTVWEWIYGKGIVKEFDAVHCDAPKGTTAADGAVSISGEV